MAGKLPPNLWLVLKNKKLFRSKHTDPLQTLTGQERVIVGQDLDTFDIQHAKVKRGYVFSNDCSETHQH